jgi:hypothetical protein
LRDFIEEVPVVGVAGVGGVFADFVFAKLRKRIGG